MLLTWIYITEHVIEETSLETHRGEGRPCGVIEATEVGGCPTCSSSDDGGAVVTTEACTSWLWFWCASVHSRSLW